MKTIVKGSGFTGRILAVIGSSVLLASFFMLADAAPAFALGTCTAAARGISSFSCPGTPTEDVCGNVPNLSCYAEASEPACGVDKHFDCGSCSCACNAGLVNCAGTCKPILTCPAGLVADSCAQTCTTPYVMLKTATPPGGVFPQSGGIQVTGDINTAGDFYLASGKALRVDAAGASVLNLGNYGGGTFKVDVGGTVQGTQFCIGASCISAWPGGGGGGTVTSIGVGSGLSAAPTNPITGAGTISLDTTFTDGRYVKLSGATMTGALIAPNLTANTSIATPQLCLSGTCLSSWPAGGTGTVTRINQGAGIIATPNPITGVGSVALDTSYTDGQYVNIAGDTMTGQLNMTDARLSGAAGFGGYNPDVNWKVSSPSGYFGIAGASTFIGAGDVTTDNTVTGNVVKGNSQLCIGADCRSFWPVAGGGTVTSVSAGNGLSSVPSPIVGAGTINVGAGSGITVAADTVSLNTGFTDPLYVNVSGDTMTGNLTAPNLTANTAVFASQLCLPGVAPSGGCINAWPVAGAGDITDVVAGDGLIGGAASGAATVNVGAGSGITIAADTVSLNTGFTDSLYVNVNGDTMIGALTAPNLTANTSVATPQLCLSGTCRSTWPSISQGTGIIATPNPITGAGSIALDTAYANGQYVNVSGDTMTGSLVLSGASTNLSVGGGINIGTAAGATAGQIQASAGITARSTAGVYAGNFMNDAGTSVTLANSNYGVYSNGAGVYGGVFTNRNSAAQVYIAGAGGSYGVYAAAPEGGYAFYGVGKSKFTLDMEAASLTTNQIRLSGVDKVRWPVWQAEAAVSNSGCIIGSYAYKSTSCASGNVVGFTCYLPTAPNTACASRHVVDTGIDVLVPCNQSARVSLLCQ